MAGMSAKAFNNKNKKIILNTRDLELPFCKSEMVYSRADGTIRA